MTESRRQVLLSATAFLGGTVAGLAAGTVIDGRVQRPGRRVRFNDSASEFRRGEYAVFRGVVLSPSEMAFVAERIENNPKAPSKEEDVLELLVPTNL